MTTKDKIIAALALLALLALASPVSAQTTWTSGVSYAWTVQGGLSSLPAITGVSINPGSTARVYDSGGTVYQYRAVFSGTTVNNSPYRISPSDLQAGGTNSGVSMWELQGLAGDTVFARTLVIDTTTVRPTDVAGWNNIESHVTEFVRGLLRDMLAAGAFSGTTEFKKLGDIRSEIVSGNSIYVLHSAYAQALAAGAFTGVTEFQNLAAVRAAAASAVSPYPTTAESRSYSDSSVSPYSTTAQSRSYTDSAVSPYSTTTQSRAYADSAVSPYVLHSAHAAALGPGAVSSVSMYAIPALDADHSGTSIYTVNFSVISPENLLPGGGTTPFRIFAVDPSTFPSGVTVISFDVRVTSGNTDYGLTYQEWDGNSLVREIGKVWAGPTTGVSGYQSGATVVQAGHEVFVSPPTTGAHVISGTMKYTRRK